MKDHIHLHPVDVNYDDMNTSKNDGSMTPALSDDKELTKKVTGGYYKMMKKIAEISNQNLVWNADAYISNSRKIDPDNEFSWIDESYKQRKKNFN